MRSHYHDQQHDWNRRLYRGLIATIVSAHYISLIVIYKLPLTPTIYPDDFMSGVTGINFFLAHQIRISEILPWDRKSYPTHAILPRTSSNFKMHI